MTSLSFELIVSEAGADRPHHCGHKAQLSSQGGPRLENQKERRPDHLPLGKQHEFVTEII